MPTTKNDPTVTCLTTVATEQEAALIVAALEDDGIEAHFAGETAASFRLGVPGGVQVFVRKAELAAAQVLQYEFEASESDETDDQEADEISNWRLFVKLLVVIMLAGIAMSFLGDLLEVIRTL
jgi:hypothetical protein